jgi:hypothetical protein
MPSLQFWEDAPLIRRPIWVWVDALLESDDQGGGNKAQVIAEQLPDLMRQGYNESCSGPGECMQRLRITVRPHPLPGAGGMV